MTSPLRAPRGRPGAGAGAPAGLAATPSGQAVLAYAMQTMVRLLEPFAPHMCAELWQMMGGSDIWDAPWPQADERFLQAETIELAVQVNGKVRDRVVVAKDAPNADVLAAAKALPAIAKYLEGATLVKEVVVPGAAGQPGGEMSSEWAPIAIPVESQSQEEAPSS